MSAITNITVKKSDGTTDVTFTAIAGAPGEGQPAIWQDLTSSTIRGNRSALAMQSKMNGTKTARRVDVNANFVVSRIIDGIETRIGNIPGTFSMPVPEWATDAEVAQAADQFINLLASSHIRTHVKAGASPT